MYTGTGSAEQLINSLWPPPPLVLVMVVNKDSSNQRQHSHGQDGLHCMHYAQSRQRERERERERVDYIIVDRSAVLPDDSVIRDRSQNLTQYEFARRRSAAAEAEDWVRAWVMDRFLNISTTPKSLACKQQQPPGSTGSAISSKHLVTGWKWIDSQRCSMSLSPRPSTSMH